MILLLDASSQLNKEAAIEEITCLRIIGCIGAVYLPIPTNPCPKR